jgi:hypothetical protein
MLGDIIADSRATSPGIRKDAPSIFDSSEKDAGIAAPIRSMTLASTEVLENNLVWLRYRLQLLMRSGGRQ